MKAMVLAAGYGTRLRPLSDLVPKPMIPLGNRPLVFWILDGLVRAGATGIVVNLHHRPDMFRGPLREAYGDSVELQLSVEDEILGTGGGLARVRERFESEETFVMLNGDTIQFPDFERLVAWRKETEAVAAVALRHPPAGDRFTTVRFHDGLVTGFGRGEGEALMFAGVHAISPRIFDLLPASGEFDIVSDGYVRFLESGVERIAGVVDDQFWFDVGTPERYLAAADAVRARQVAGELPLHGSLRSGGASVVDAGASIEGVVDRSTVGAGVAVGRGATVERSVVWSEARIGANARVTGSILAGGVSIPAGVRVSNAIVSPRGAVDSPDAGRIVGDWLIVPVRAGEPVEFGESKIED